MFTWEQNEIPNQGVVSNFQGLTYEIGPNPWGNFRLKETWKIAPRPAGEENATPSGQP